MNGVLRSLSRLGLLLHDMHFGARNGHWEEVSTSSNPSDRSFKRAPGLKAIPTTPPVPDALRPLTAAQAALRRRLYRDGSQATETSAGELCVAVSVAAPRRRSERLLLHECAER